MPKRYGIKEKDQVVAYLINLVLTGRLRTGDRVDRGAIAETLGLSRVPIQEAIVQLEHDGILSTRYHRGAFVERFDEAAVREQHEIYGLLTGIAAARAAAAATPQLLDQLDTLMAALRAATQTKAVREACWSYRRVIDDGYAGPRLRAMIIASQSLIPLSFWEINLTNTGPLLPFYEIETAAIHRGDPGAARAACAGRSEWLAQTMLAELFRRRVLRPPAFPALSC